MSEYVSCVIREVNGWSEYRRIEDLSGLPIAAQEGEKVFSGYMTRTMVKSGPSNSHHVVVWVPRGALVESVYTSST